MAVHRHVKKYSPLAIFIFLIVAFFLYSDPFKKAPDCGSNCTPAIPANTYPQTIGQCRNCMPLKDSGIPYNSDIGEYVDLSAYKKLQLLAKINPNWRVTEAYPPTVKHLSFCHYVGTCVDIGLYHSKVNEQNLRTLCKDAVTSGFTVINEYSSANLQAASDYCPSSQTFETTTGANLHIY